MGSDLALREALTPTGETKAAYMGEFSWTEWLPDEHGIEQGHERVVPWTTIKDIMSAIRARAGVDVLDEADALDERAATAPVEYLVWSNEHAAWWGRDRCGYTRIIASAGRYSRAEALIIAGTRGGGWYPGKGNPDEIAIPVQDAIDQYAGITRAQEPAAPAALPTGAGE